jgi:protein phosphatase
MSERSQTAVYDMEQATAVDAVTTGLKHLTLECVGMTDVGRARDHNEDDFFLSQNDEALCIVADGMGGHRSGEVASALAIKTMVEYYRDHPVESLDVGEDADPHAQRLTEAIQAANSAVFESASRNELYRGMGTTIVSGYFTYRRVYLGHIGDSRVYRFRDGGLVQLTDDHSLANEYLEMGILSDDQVEFFPYKNVITRACGLGEDVEVATGVDELRPGDVFLFCSDGLTDMIPTERLTAMIDRALDEGRPLGELCRSMVERANDNGGEDNITVVLAHATSGA